VKILERIEDAYNAVIAYARRKSKIYDHIWRARQRYNDVLGGRLAAAIAYYAFFACFALALIAYSIVGYVLASNAAAVAAVNKFLAANIPFLDAEQIRASRTTVGVLGLIGLVLTGLGWIESMRSAQRAIWRLDQQPGNVFIRRLVDLGTLVATGLLLALSLWVQTGINNNITPLLFRVTSEGVSVDTQQTILTVAKVVTPVLALLVNCVLAVSLLAGVSRVRMPLRRLLPSTALVAVGLLLLSTVGRIYINYSANRPAYQFVGGTVALLLFLYLFSQLLLYGAALAATSHRGKIVDLAAGPPPGDAALDRNAVDATRVFRRRKRP
jgi:membrane protein